MKRAFFIFAVAVGLGFSASALTGQGDSAVGALETISPTVTGVTVLSETSIAVSFSEAMLEPGVSTPGNYAISGTGVGSLAANPDAVSGSGPYMLTWSAGEMLDGGTVTITVTGVQDTVGNLIDPAQNSASGPSVPPVISNLVATPAQAAANTIVTITFTVSEPLDADPIVTVNGNDATWINGGKAVDYTYEYLVQQSDPLGMAAISIQVFDLVGNEGALNDSTALEIVFDDSGLPIRGAWVLFIALPLAGLMIVMNRRRRTAMICVFMMIVLAIAPKSFAEAPTVSNVTFAQGPDGIIGTKVDIYYDLVAPNGPCDITVWLSKDGGVNFDFAVSSISGAVTNVDTGAGHYIIWDIATDYPDEDIPNAVIRIVATDEGGPEMLPVAAGTFEMGDPWNEGDSNEVPVHEVTLDAYEIGKFSVTNQQYADVLNWALAQGYLTDSVGGAYTGGLVYAYGQPIADTESSNTYSQITFSGGVFGVRSREGYDSQLFSMADHPMVRVSWYGAVAYCNWLSEIEGVQPCYDTSTWERYEPVRNGYRLPTEAEWERAAAWDGTKHWRYGMTSDTIDITRANYYDGNYANPLGLTSYPYTSPVGWYDGVNPAQLSAPGTLTVHATSPVGAYDMSGNVFEWCHDWWYRVYTTDPVSNPTGPGSGDYRVLRGGRWYSFAYGCRAAFRSNPTPDDRDYSYGFRVARTP